MMYWMHDLKWNGGGGVRPSTFVQLVTRANIAISDVDEVVVKYPLMAFEAPRSRQFIALCSPTTAENVPKIVK